MKRLGFLSFGHYGPVQGSRTRTASDMLHQSVDLAVAAEEVGAHGAFVRVHHFARQAGNPFAVLAAIAARTSTLEMGTGVIDMRYENPLALAEVAASLDLLSDQRLQLGISRGSPETVVEGYRSFGYEPQPGDERAADLARQHTDRFLEAVRGRPMAMSDPRMTGMSRPVALEPRSETLPQRIWWGSGTRATARWAAEQGLNLMSSTLLTEDTGVPFDQLQAEQLRDFRAEWARHDRGWTPRVSVSRSVLPVFDDETRRYFGLEAQREGGDQVGVIDGFVSRFGKSYVGEPDAIAADLAADEAVAEADTLLVTVPNQLGVDFNARLLEVIVREILPALPDRGHDLG
ncbi:MAG: LLM class flavin-dependent oxidoreductase [Propionibacteriaceae bacterium]|nr:LLM class flavin-dependent oxidoreductase [Propionibacteriaceae bacterium]